MTLTPIYFHETFTRGLPRVFDNHVDRLTVAGERPIVGAVVYEVLLAADRLCVGLVGEVRYRDAHRRADGLLVLLITGHGRLFLRLSCSGVAACYLDIDIHSGRRRLGLWRWLGRRHVVRPAVVVVWRRAHVYHGRGGGDRMDDNARRRPDHDIASARGHVVHPTRVVIGGTGHDDGRRVARPGGKVYT